MCRSGSAMEIMKPRERPPSATTQTLLLLAICDPKRVPMGVTPMSAPKRNTDSPRMITNAPRMKRSSR